MAKWVQCRSALVPGEPVFINLDRIIAIVPTPSGTEITYGPQASLYVEDAPAAILGNEGLRRA